MSTGNKTHFQSNDAFWVNTKFMYGQYKYISIENTFKNGKIYEKILKLKKNVNLFKKSILPIYSGPLILYILKYKKMWRPAIKS